MRFCSVAPGSLPRGRSGGPARRRARGRGGAGRGALLRQALRGRVPPEGARDLGLPEEPGAGGARRRGGERHGFLELQRVPARERAGRERPDLPRRGRIGSPRQKLQRGAAGRRPRLKVRPRRRVSMRAGRGAPCGTPQPSAACHSLAREAGAPATRVPSLGNSRRTAGPRGAHLWRAMRFLPTRALCPASAAASRRASQGSPRDRRESAQQALPAAAHSAGLLRGHVRAPPPPPPPAPAPAYRLFRPVGPGSCPD